MKRKQTRPKAAPEKDIKLTAAPSIGDIMINVNKPWRPTGCRCAELRTRLRADGICLPEVKGHIFAIGREFEGTKGVPMRQTATNTLRCTQLDAQRAWDKAWQALPEGMAEKAEWTKEMARCVQPMRESKAAARWISTRETYQLRKLTDGLVIGPIDKNPGELSAMCPTLYEEARDKLYGEGAGYVRIFPPKYRRKNAATTTPEAMVRAQKQTAPCQECGDEKDIVKAWGSLYKSRGWAKYAPFNNKGGFNEPYLQFKAKNITDYEVRKEKGLKARPIAPGTRHPMRSLLHIAGRAWSFVTATIPGEHFVLKEGGQVPQFLKAAAERVSSQGELKYVIKDVEGCFPNMPKPEIMLAARDILQEHGKYKRTGVWVPSVGAKNCRWNQLGHKGKWLPFDVLLQVLEFSLENAIVKVKGVLKHQSKGIPMGDPLSPAMTIGTCAWMEGQWLQTLKEADKQFFTAARYMDDILMVYADSPNWDSKCFLRDFEKSECYHPPLKLEDAAQGTYLESTFTVVGGKVFRFWLKNDNADGKRKIWRYQHFHSAAPYEQKRSTLAACLGKVTKMASDDDALIASAHAKLCEFRQLQYPVRMLKGACTYLAATTKRYQWIQVREALG